MIPAGYFDRADAPSKGSPVAVMMLHLAEKFTQMGVEEFRNVQRKKAGSNVRSIAR
jgi:hypothetical protein